MVPDLSPIDVTVFDVARGQAHTGEASGDASDGQLIQRVREFTRQYEEQIQKALAFIPLAVVVVHVDVDNLKSSVTRHERTRVRGDSAPVANRPASLPPSLFDNEPTPQVTGFRGASTAFFETEESGLRESPKTRSSNPPRQRGSVASGTTSDSLADAAGYFSKTDTIERESAAEPRESTLFDSAPSTAFRGANELVPAGHSDVQREVSEKQLLAAMPRAVQVSVSIPRDYYRDVAARRRSQGEQNEARLDLDTIEEDVIAKVERTVARLIPVGSPHEAISVTSVDRLTSDDTEPTLTANEQLLVLAQRHGGSCLLSLFAVWSLWMLTRLTRPPAHSIKSPMASAASLEPMPLSHDVSSTISPTINTPLEPRSPKPRTPQPVTAATSDLLDDIRHLAESDPATAAAVISRWLQAANT